MFPRTSELIGEPLGEPEPLDGGITNRNFRVRTGSGDYVIRLFGKDTSQLGIDRRAEQAASEAAAAVGVGAEVIAFLDDAAITRFIDGRPIPPEELRASPGGVAAALRAVHAGGTLPAEFNAFRIVEDYRERAGGAPDAFGEALERAREIEAALTGPEHEPVPCHNDLLNANLIDDGERVRIVDWEYAGMGDAAGEIRGRVTTGGYGYTVERSIAYAYLPTELASPGTAVEIEVFGDWVDAEVAKEPLLDPQGERVRGVSAAPRPAS